MANNTTYRAQRLGLGGLAGGGIIRAATSIRLYKVGSAPNKDGSGFTEVDNGNGYTTGGRVISFADWVEQVVGGAQQVKLFPGGADVYWQAAGGSIVNVLGAYLMDAVGPLVWWPRPSGARTFLAGEKITLADLVLEAI
jgi:hypothetical protein